ncbi:hypothetical protein [Amycolatopsis sp. cmx-11-32]|uniref:hypothetical protein n=1 Tax=Amycolatopsis sp. cmx-11-32 TaxID=2785796 RepID=UPI0039E49B79
MVGTNGPDFSPAIPVTTPIPHEVVAHLMRTRPHPANSPLSDRVGWLFEMADALAAAGGQDDADTTRTLALDLVRDAVTIVAGGGVR